MKTAVYNVRLDIRAIATIHKHYSTKGLSFNSVSTLNRMAIQALSEMVVSQLGAIPFNNTVDAVNYLEEQNLMKPLRSRGNTSLIKQMQLEALSADGLNTSYAKKKGKTTINPDQFEAAKRILQKEDSAPILGKLPGTIKDKEEE